MNKLADVASLGKTLVRRISLLFKENPDKYLKKISGVIHVGANTGQEIRTYQSFGLSVLWIEPIPEVFDKLVFNLIGVPAQTAIKGLVTDEDDKEYVFHLATNNGASSSILELNLHQDIWPDVTFEKNIKIYSKTLATLLSDNRIDPSKYDMLIIDTQGSELLVLKGAEPVLHYFTYIQTEVPDFEAYKGCCQLKDLELFMEINNYREVFRRKFASHPDGGSYYDIIYTKNSK